MNCLVQEVKSQKSSFCGIFASLILANSSQAICVTEAELRKQDCIHFKATWAYSDTRNEITRFELFSLLPMEVNA
jgi:hypothetical protein